MMRTCHHGKNCCKIQQSQVHTKKFMHINIFPFK
jgi:hypothetical protein